MPFCKLVSLLVTHRVLDDDGSVDQLQLHETMPYCKLVSLVTHRVLDDDGSVEYVSVAAHQSLEGGATQERSQHLGQVPTGDRRESGEIGDIWESGDVWEVGEVGDLSTSQL